MSTSTDFPQPHRVPLPLPPASPPESAVTLIHQAHQCVVEAARLTDPAERFATAYLGALRAAAAVPALRGRPHRGRAKPTSVWVLLPELAPELAEWAAFFADCSDTREAVEAGITRQVTRRAAADLVRQAAQFGALVDGLMHEGGQ